MSGLDDSVSIEEVAVYEQQDIHQGECQLSLGSSPAEARRGWDHLGSNEEVTVYEQEGSHQGRHQRSLNIH